MREVLLEGVRFEQSGGVVDWKAMCFRILSVAEAEIKDKENPKTEPDGF